MCSSKVKLKKDKGGRLLVAVMVKEQKKERITKGEWMDLRSVNDDGNDDVRKEGKQKSTET